jgi:hypothetical protein
MARGTLDEIESEGDFALGMGLVIGAFIALFSAAIAWFVIEQGREGGPPPERSRPAAANPGESPAVARSHSSD